MSKNYYFNIEDCKSHSKTNTNPRYRHFCQTNYTAGDIEQFQNGRDYTNHNVENIDLEKNIFKTVTPNIWNAFSDLDTESVDNTFNYIFHKFKKGIYIKILNNQLKVFLPFSNKNFINEWSSLIKVHPKYGNFTNFFRHISKLENRNFNEKNINKFTDCWYANNGLLRYEFPIHEGDTNDPIIYDMFDSLCKSRKVPDMEFFVNRRDFPLFKRDSTEPYEHIYSDKHLPLVSHKYDKYSPVFSMSDNRDFADIAIPTCDDWARVSREEGKFFIHNYKRSYDMSCDIEWKDKKPVAVFRGASTGIFTDMRNPRIKLAYMSSLGEKDSDGQPYLDAGITEWNLRPRKIFGKQYLETIEIDSLKLDLVKPLTPKTQAEYKYIINVDGHVCAYRLSLEMQSRSCILLAQSKYHLWFFNLLKPYKHYIPIRADLTDLIDKIKWCKNNDDKCKKIAENAFLFWKKYLNRDSILDYLQNTLIKVSNKIGNYTYNYITVKEVENMSIEKLLTPYIYDLDIDEKIEIFRNNNTVISKVQDILVEKSTRNVLHETFVGIYCLNKLKKLSPNFIYTYGWNKDKIFLQYIEGEKLLDFIKSPEFTIDIYKNILIQIALSLEIAQNMYNFLHNDLTSWNVIIKKLPETKDITYNIKGEIYTVNTDIVPIVIDAGRSSFVYKDIRYSEKDPFYYSTIQDLLSLLFTSIYEITNLNLGERDSKEIIHLLNFITATEYKSQKFYNIGQVRYFLNRNKKYTELLTSDKKDLENKSPIDFVKYLNITSVKNTDNKVKNIKFKFTTNPVINCYNMYKTGDFSFQKDNLQLFKKYRFTKPFKNFINLKILEKPEKVLEILKNSKKSKSYRKYIFEILNSANVLDIEKQYLEQIENAEDEFNIININSLIFYSKSIYKVNIQHCDKDIYREVLET